VSGAALLVLTVLAACVGAIVAEAADANAPVVTIQAMAAVVVMDGFRRLDLPRTRLFAAGELLVLIAVAGAGWWLGDAGDAGDALAGLAVSLVVWLLAVITATDLDAVAAPADLVEGIGGATGRLNHRLLLVGTGLGIVVIAARGGFVPPTTSRSLGAGLVTPFLVYWLVGLIALTALHRQRLAARWERDGVRVDPVLGDRWRQALGTGLVLLLVAAGVWWWASRPLLAIAHQGSASIFGAAGRALARLSGEEPPPQFQQGEPSGELPPPPEPLNPIRPPAEIWDLLLLVGVAVFFGAVYLFFSRRRSSGAPPLSATWARVISSALRVVADLLRALFGLFRRLRLPRLSRQRARADKITKAPAGSRGWLPSDPVRQRIAAAFRRQVDLATAAVGAPNRSETPLEYSFRVEPDPRLTDLAGIYGEARYSNHKLDSSKAELAEELDRRLAEAWDAQV